jgi:hypothetical protein
VPGEAGAMERLRCLAMTPCAPVRSLRQACRTSGSGQSMPRTHGRLPRLGKTRAGHLSLRHCGVWACWMGCFAGVARRVGQRTSPHHPCMLRTRQERPTGWWCWVLTSFVLLIERQRQDDFQHGGHSLGVVHDEGEEVRADVARSIQAEQVHAAVEAGSRGLPHRARQARRRAGTAEVAG